MSKALKVIPALFYFLVMTTSAKATLYSYTTILGDGGPGAGINYSLNITSLGSNNYSAIFTIDPTASTLTSYWTAGWFLFKLGNSTPATLSSLSSPSGTGTWNIANPGSTVQVAMGGGNYQTLLHNGFSGFYNTGFSNPPGGSVNLNTGIILTPNGTSQTFNYNFNTSGFPIPISFQVGYYDGLAGKSGNYVFNQLSQSLSPPQLPAPATLSLLGAGLVILAVTARKKRFPL